MCFRMKHAIDSNSSSNEEKGSFTYFMDI